MGLLTPASATPKAWRYLPPPASGSVQSLTGARPFVRPEYLVESSQTISSASIQMPPFQFLTAPPTIASIPSDEAYLATLSSPAARWKFLARHRPLQFVTLVLGAIVVVYACFAGLPTGDAAVSYFFSMAAWAQEGGVLADGALLTPANVFLACIAIITIWSLGTVSFAKAAEKIKLAGDAVKMILGFLVGFFSGSQAR